MASTLHILATSERDDGRIEQAVRATAAHLDHLERCWSRFIATSDISTLNRLGATGGGELAVDSSTLSLIAAMVEGYERTAGRFDPTLLRAVMAEGYVRSHTDPEVVCDAPSAIGRRASVHDVVLDLAAGTVAVPAGLSLDPGGIGKGLAADLAVARLLDTGASGALVAIGGDLAMAGTPIDPAGWLVDVEHPDPDDGVLCHLAISGGGVATSSTRSRRWTVDGTERHHQIDPATERCSATDLATVTVIAPAGWLAEVHASAALGAGSGGAIDYLDGHGLSGIAVADDGTVSTTADLTAIELCPRGGAR